MKLTIPHGTKLKDAPFENRILMRLVALQARRINTANLRTICHDEGNQYAVGMTALNLMINEGHVAVEADDSLGDTFKFKVDSKVVQAVQRQASNYHQMLAARSNQPVNRPPLPPIPEEDRAKHKKAVAKLVNLMSALEKNHISWQLQGCAARIGIEHLEQLVTEVEIEFEPKDKHPKASAMAALMKAYCQLRNEIIPVEEYVAK